MYQQKHIHIIRQIVLQIIQLLHKINLQLHHKINYLSFVPTKAHTYIKTNCITNAPTCFGASAPSLGSFDIAFAKL